MRSNNLACIILIFPLLLLSSGCGGGGGTPSGPSITDISVTPANATVPLGGTQQYTATATRSDGSTSDVTSQVTWSATNAGVVISSTGLATASSTPGTATITAVLGSISRSALLTVGDGSVAGGGNSMAVTVNGSLCSSATSGGYFNKPCVAVTVCNPDGSACQLVNDILLDTGSYGLRIFRQAIPNLNLPQVSSGTGAALAECIHFADQSTIWGPVQVAKVQMGSEPPVLVPIHVIDAGFATPVGCGTPDASPSVAKYTGILGVGPLQQDCGPTCANFSRVGFYFGCTGASCTDTIVPLANQVQNPVASLPADKNGVLVQFPPVPVGGVSTLNGSLVFGIGTQSNNTPTAAPTVFRTNLAGEFSTTFNGSTLVGFLDTGSNALFFPSSLPICQGGDWYCPPATTSLTAVNTGAGGSPSLTVPFTISNADALFATSNSVFSDIGGVLGPTFTDFDWGLPFFMGRSVFFGINGAASSLGTGPFVAY